MEYQEAASTISATLARLGIAQTDLGEVSATIARRIENRPESSPLPRIAIDGGDLTARGELGRGGMGVVRIAEQHSLLREVAIKTVLAESPAASTALVREARVMGSLEHPNLVPVHALGMDDAGAPVLVMKRIEGVSWRVLLTTPDHEAWEPLLVGHVDRLRANLEILSQVCRALAFAHARGVVHRDVKPENVMIGRFGEVYLLDWGVALRLSDAPNEPATIVGTPGYFAPEMARGDARLVDARTDVHLLGGTLYELLTGRMPHEAPSPLAALVSALLGKIPAIPDETPRDLATLVRAAMAMDPGERVASADAFREALQRHLASRAAEAIAEDARAAITRANDAITKEGAGSRDAFRALTEARFGFLSAERVRVGDVVLRAELDHCLTLLAKRELALRSPAGARAFLAELSSPHDELSARVLEVEEELERDRAATDALHKARRNLDASVGLHAMQRAITVAAIVSVPVLALIAWHSWTSGRETPIAWAVVGNLATLAGTLLAIAAGRRTVLANEGTRRVAGFLALCPTTVCCCNFASFAAGRSLENASATTAAALACLCMLGTLTTMGGLWPAIPLALAAVPAVVLAPKYANTISLFFIPGMLVILARAVRLEAEHSRVGTEDTASH